VQGEIVSVLRRLTQKICAACDGQDRCGSARAGAGGQLSNAERMSSAGIQRALECHSSSDHRIVELKRLGRLQREMVRRSKIYRYRCIGEK